RLFDVGVGGDVSRIFTTQLEPRVTEAPRCHRAIYGVATAYRAGERDVVGLFGERGCQVVVAVDGGDETLGGTSLSERVREVLAAERAAGAVFQDHRVACQDGGDEGIDAGEQGVVPRRHVEHHAEGNPLDATLEAVLAADDGV